MADKILIDRATIQQVSDWFKWFHAGNSLEAVWSSKQCSTELRAALDQPVQWPTVPKITDAMALAFHNALTDMPIGRDEVEEIKIGLRAVLTESNKSAQQPAVPPGMTLVNSGALQMVINTLRRDAEQGKPVRGEMADELLNAAPEATAEAREPLTDAQIEAGRQEVFSTNNPFCPCDSKTMRKAVQWAERAHGITGSKA